MLGFILKVSTLHWRCLGFLVIGPFSPFEKPFRKIVKTCTHNHYTLVRLVHSSPNFSLSLQSTTIKFKTWWRKWGGPGRPCRPCLGSHKTYDHTSCLPACQQIDSVLELPEPSRQVTHWFSLSLHSAVEVEQLYNKWCSCTSFVICLYVLSNCLTGDEISTSNELVCGRTTDC